MDLTKGIDLIKEFEGCELTAYQDQGGVWTIGYGTTGPAVYDGLTISQDEAEDLLLAKATYYARQIDTATERKLNQNQICALTSFTYNVGLGNFLGSTLRKMILAGNEVQHIADEFTRWDKIKGEIVDGLLRRRQAERELFLEPV